MNKNFFIQLQTQVQEEARVRASLWIAGFLLFGYGILMIADWRADHKPELQRLADDFARLEQIMASADWHERASEMENARAELLEKFRTASSRGVARANFEALLLSYSDQAGLSRPRVEIRSVDDVEGQPDLIQLVAQLEADHNPSGLVTLGRQFAAEDIPLRVLNLTTSSQRPNRMRVDVLIIMSIAPEETR